MKAELKPAVLATGSSLMEVHGIRPAATILADSLDIARFPRRSHFASWNGTAPIYASSGQHAAPALPRRDGGFHWTSNPTPCTSISKGLPGSVAVILVVRAGHRPEIYL
jgi:Transposase IS116/IS110/IS902 family